MTEFSSQRRTQYLTQLEREQAVDTFAGDYLDFLRSCRLELEVFEPREPDQIERCLELVQRSNQLNLSKRAYTRKEFEALLGTTGILAVALEARDHFGQYGIVGFVAVDERGETPAVCDFVLSCRIAQKRIEHAFLGWLAEREAERGATRLRADLVKDKPERAAPAGVRGPAVRVHGCRRRADQLRARPAGRAAGRDRLRARPAGHVIVVADDLGEAEGTNRAIIQALEKGSRRRQA